jgi:hypothetical protein
MAEVSREPRESCVNIHACPVPRGETVDGKGVAQIVRARSDPTTERLEPQATEHAANDARDPRDEKRLAVRTNQERSMGCGRGKAVAMSSILLQFLGQVFAEWNPARLPFALPDIEHASVEVDILDLKPDGLAKA